MKKKLLRMKTHKIQRLLLEQSFFIFHETTELLDNSLGNVYNLHKSSFKFFRIKEGMRVGDVEISSIAIIKEEFSC